MMTLNCNSLVALSRRTELKSLIEELQLDIVLIQETWLEPRHNLNFSGYNSIRTHSIKSVPHSIGTAILLKDKINYTRFTIPFRHIIYTAVTINLKNCNKIAIVSIYLSPNLKSDEINSDLVVLKEHMSSFEFFIVGGDYNARHTSWDDTTNSAGRRINSLINDNPGFTLISPEKPTFQDISKIDHFIVSSNLILNGTYSNFIKHNIPCFSDHDGFAVKIDIKTRLDLMELQPKSNLNFAPNKIIPFVMLLHREMLKVDISEYVTYNKQEIDTLIKTFTTVIQEAQNKVFKFESVRKSKFDNLPTELQNLYKTKNSLKKSLSREKARGYRTEKAVFIAQLLNRASKIFKKKVSEYHKQIYEKRLENLKPGSNLFQTANSLVGRKKFEPPRCLKITNQLNYDPSIITKEFEKTYKQIYNQPTNNYFSDSPLQITSFDSNNNSINPSIEPDKFTSIQRIKDILKQSNNKKSSGPDKISNFIIKKLTYPGIKALTIILNNCINISYFPVEWKIAKIIPFPKKQKPMETSDYRPLSLTNNLGKILESIILERLHHHIEEKELIPKFQFGFRHGHSTVDALSHFREKITEAINNRKSMAVCLFDIEKAFDTVNHHDIKRRLTDSDIDANTYAIVDSFLSGRQAFVQISDNNPSNTFSINRGVPQGTKLGPILYNISTIDQPQSLTVPTIQYADDTILYSSSLKPKEAMKNLNPHAQKLVDYYRSKNIRINTGKTKLIIFTPSGDKFRSKTTMKNSKRASLTLDGQVITPSDTVKYLGVTFHNKFKFHHHMNTVLNRARFAYNILSPIITNKKVNQKSKTILYKQIIRPIILYASIIWSTISKSSNEKIERMERKIIRKILNVKYIGHKYVSNHELYRRSKLMEISKYNQIIIANALIRIKNHSNDLIKGIPLRSPFQTVERYPTLSTMYNNEIDSIRRNPQFYTM